MTPEFRYRATLVRAIDGDTYEMLVDLGFHVHRRLTVRLQGVDAWELGQPGGPDARAFAERQMWDAREVTVQSYKDRQSFARWVCDVWVDGVPLARLLAEAGHAKRAGDQRVL